MNTPHEAIKYGLRFARRVTLDLLADLTDEQLLVRPVDGANHIAWQLGHLICTEHRSVGAIAKARMPELPTGFADRYTPATATDDQPDHFESKQRYLDLYDAVRAETINVLECHTPEELATPSPDFLRSLCRTVGEVLILQANHELMHVGQFTVVRRKLGIHVAF